MFKFKKSILFIIVFFAFCFGVVNAASLPDLRAAGLYIEDNEVELDSEMIIRVTVRYSIQKPDKAFKVALFINDEKIEEKIIDEMPDDPEDKNLYFTYSPKNLGANTIKVIVDSDDDIYEYTNNYSDNNIRERTFNVVMPPSPFSVIDVATSIDYFIVNSSEQTISFFVKSKKDYNDGVNNSRLYLYYFNEDEYNKGGNYQFSSNNTSSSGRIGILIDESGKYGRFRTDLPNTQYYYIIADKAYQEISINDKSKILKEGSFTTLDLIDKSSGSDYEVIPNSFNINYLEGDEYKESRELYYAKVEFEYYNDLKIDHEDGKRVRHTIKNKTTNKTLNTEFHGFGLTRVKSKTGMYLTKNEFGNFFKNGDNELEGALDSLNAIFENNENNNTVTQTLILSNVDEVSDSIINVDGTVKSPGIRVVDSSENMINNTNNNTVDTQITQITTNANRLYNNQLSEILTELNELRNTVKEQEFKIKYLTSLKKNVQALSGAVENAINNFITYGVDDNTKKLGSGERAAVMHSFKSAFNKLPESEEELADAIKIANGRWPSARSENAEKKAKKQFEKIYKKIANMDNPHDNAAITVMAYGLRQKAENRNLDSERAGIKTFQAIYGYHPASTEDWNIMQAVTYSGSSRGIDIDGDLLLDEREVELGTDPNNPDTDGDGFSDGEEVANGYDPLKK